MQIPFVSNLMNLSPIQRQSIIQFGFTVLITVFGFISTMLFSHILGSDLLGVYYLFLTYYSIFNLIGDGGFAAAAIKRISEGHDQREFMTAYAFLRTVLIIISTLILLMIEPLFVDLAEYHIVPWIIGALILAYFAGMVSTWVSGQGHMGIINMSSGGFELARILFSVLLVLLGFSVYGMLGGYLAAIVVGAILSIKYFNFKPAKFGLSHIKSLLIFSFWVLLISGSSMLLTYSDTIFLGYFMSNSDVGIYRVALQFTTIAAIVSSAIASTLAPKISNWSYNGQMELIPPVISRSITMGLVVAVPIAAGGLLLSEKFLYYFYGAEFASGASVCSIFLIYQILGIVLVFFNSALTNSGHVKKTFIGTFGAVILNVILDIMLIPVFGLIGAAVASILSLALNLLLVYILLKKVMHVALEWKSILHMLLATLAMVIFVVVYMVFVPLDNVFLTLLPVVIGAGIYFILLFKVDKGIRNELADMVRKFGLKWPEWL